MHRCQRIEVSAGEVIARITVPTGEGRTTSVRSLGRYTTVGEMGIVAKQPRSATIQAEVASVLYVLRLDTFDAIRVDNPALSQKLLIYFMSLMAERLAFASRMIGVFTPIGCNSPGCLTPICVRPRDYDSYKPHVGRSCVRLQPWHPRASPSHKSGIRGLEARQDLDG
ncbi:hypothetical protein V1291_002949 [Nitrobacteraceae bacterium AZCC 1564]